MKRIALMVGILTGLYTMQLGVTSELLPADSIEASAEEQPQNEVVVQSIDAIHYSSQVNVDHEVAIIDELPEAEEESQIGHVKDQIVTKSLKVFKILFNRIIAPNAP